MEWMVLPLKRYAEFGGRSRRQEFWMFVLGTVLLYLVLGVVATVIGVGAVGMASSNAAAGGAAGMVGFFASMGILAVVFGLVWLGLLIPTLAVSVRRLHDTDRTGWWIMLYIAPYILSIVFSLMGASSRSNTVMMLGSLMSMISLIGAIVLIVFYCLPGTPGPNRYGADPLGTMGDLAETFR